MVTGLISHYRAGTGAVLVETREEGRLLASLLAELPPGAQVFTCAAPGGKLKNARTGQQEGGAEGLAAGYAWASSGAGRVLVVHDWHTLINSPGHWRGLLEALPLLRSPRGAGESDAASLVVFVGPAWDMQPSNPLRGSIPLVQFALPSRADLRAVAESLAPLGALADGVTDSLCGLTAQAAEQAAAECLAAKQRWDIDHLRASRRQALREAGLEIWPAVSELGGLGGFRSYVDGELIPWVRDSQLSIRRLLAAGVPGVGKSYCARWLAGRLGCECARLSIPALKAGLVGASEQNLRRALRALDALGAESPLVCVMDEIDTVAREGMDGGTSSGMFSELLTWLQESTSQVVVLATLNRLDKLDSALESRFQSRWFFDLPSAAEREAVATIHYSRLSCAGVSSAATWTAERTEGFSSREIAEQICPSVARVTSRSPSAEAVAQVCASYTPVSATQADQLTIMRRAAASLRRAGDAPEVGRAPGRRVMSAGLRPGEVFPNESN